MCSDAAQGQLLAERVRNSVLVGFAWDLWVRRLRVDARIRRNGLRGLEHSASAREVWQAAGTDRWAVCAGMVKYAREPEAGAAIKTAKARASDLRTSFKNMRETAMAIKNMPLAKARSYLNRVLDHKDVVPLRRFNGSAGRTPLTKGHKFSGPGRFPEKSVKHLLDILTNAESNAESKELDTENLHITHIQVNQACHGRRRTYRAHGRINAYMSSPCHVEVILTEKVRPPRDVPLCFSRRSAIVILDCINTLGVQGGGRGMMCGSNGAVDWVEWSGYICGGVEAYFCKVGLQLGTFLLVCRQARFPKLGADDAVGDAGNALGRWRGMRTC